MYKMVLTISRSGYLRGLVVRTCGNNGSINAVLFRSGWSGKVLVSFTSTGTLPNPHFSSRAIVHPKTALTNACLRESV